MSCTQSQTLATGDGTTTQFTFTFEYRKKSDIDVSLYNTTTEEWDEQSRDDWSFAGDTVVEFDTAPPQSDTANIKISRNTNIDTLAAEFYAGSAIRAQDLNDNFDQLQMAVQDTSCNVSSDGAKIIVIEADLEDVHESIQENADAIETLENNQYTLPIASAETLGGIRVGDNLTINNDGVLSSTGGGGSGAVNKIIAGTNVTISPTTGIGNVTINSVGGAGIVFKGTANFTLAAPSNPEIGDLYLNSTAGTGAWEGFVGVTVAVDDRAFWNGTTWDRLPATGGAILWQNGGTEDAYIEKVNEDQWIHLDRGDTDWGDAGRIVLDVVNNSATTFRLNDHGGLAMRGPLEVGNTRTDMGTGLQEPGQISGVANNNAAADQRGFWLTRGNDTNFYVEYSGKAKFRGNVRIDPSEPAQNQQNSYLWLYQSEDGTNKSTIYLGETTTDSADECPRISYHGNVNDYIAFETKEREVVRMKKDRVGICNPDPSTTLDVDGTIRATVFDLENLDELPEEGGAG